MVAASVWYRAALAALLLTPIAHAQDWLAPIPHFDLAADPNDLTIRQHAEALKPVTVAGKCGAFVGQQDGSFEAWTWPVKLLSHFRMVAELKDYSVPIDVNDQAAEVEVAPDHTTITFAHASFTVREILFATPCATAGAGGVMGYAYQPNYAIARTPLVSVNRKAITVNVTDAVQIIRFRAYKP